MSWAAFGGTFVTLFVITDPLGNAPARADRAAAGGDPRSPFSSSSTASRASNPGARAPSRATGASSATARAGRRARSTRSRTAAIVNAAGSSSGTTSSQRSGVETGAPGCGRTEYAEAIVLPSPFWFASIRTPRRRAFDHCVVASCGCERTIAPATCSANARASVVGRAAVERNEDVEALAAGGLRERLEPERGEQLADEQRHLDRLPPRHLGRRVEVEEHEVGPVGPVDPRVPRVHVDAAHVRHPEQRELVVHEREVDLFALRGPLPCRDECAVGRNPVGHVRRGVLLEERLARRCRRDTGAS